MANKRLFQSLIGSLLQNNSLPKATAHNQAGGKAYWFSSKHVLAQYIATGSLNGTFYANAENQLEQILLLCDGQKSLWQDSSITTEFIAQAAVYAREKAFMEDASVLLVAVLATREETEYLKAVFPRVIDNGKMLRTFVQIIRSGVTGRKSLGTLPKKLVLDWFENRTDEQIFTNSIGNDPSLADIIRMVHPTPKTASRRALYGYLLGKDYISGDLPQIVRDYEAFKRGEIETIPNLPFQMLTSLPLSKRDWANITTNASWQTLRLNINTFARHGVLEDAEAVKHIITRLQDAEEIRQAKVLPYQLLAAYRNIITADDDDLLIEAGSTNGMTEQHIGAKRSMLSESLRGIETALETALESAIENIPALDGKVFICVDVSGSMQSPITDERKGSTTKVRCIDVAGLIASAILRKNPSAEVIPFEQHVVKTRLHTHDSVMTTAQRLAAINGGGTNCSAALRYLNEHHAIGTFVFFVSDNESWMDNQSYRSTALMHEWDIFKTRNPHARLVCLDLQPYATTQTTEREDILNIGGFSDEVFSIVNTFAHGMLSEEHWVRIIERIEL